MRSAIHLHALLDVLLPDPCPGCGGPRGLRGGAALCPGCRPADLLLPRPVPADWPIASAWTIGDYEGPLGGLVRRGKYRPDPRAMDELAGYLAAAVPGRIPRADRVCPVPVPWRRALRRGFNQAELLSRPVARCLGLPHQRLLRRRDHGEQAGRSQHERRRRQRRSFYCPAPVQGTVLLVDDVYTTGSTARACAQELITAGARKVLVLTAVAARLTPIDGSGPR